MVKLVYHTSLGPISLEYDQAVINVGSAADNELVLPHPSVQPYHCRISFQPDSLTVLAAEGGSGVTEEVGVGNRFHVGEVSFEVQHSGGAVAIPVDALASHQLPADDPDAPYFCQNCDVHFHEHEVKRIGIQGRGKHLLCPRCSRPVGLTKPVEAPRESFFRRAIKAIQAFFSGK